MKIPKFLLSSTGEGIAARWETLFTGIIPVILIASKVLGWNIVEVDLTELDGQIVIAISSLVAVWKAVAHIQGWIRNHFYKVNKLGKFA